MAEHTYESLPVAGYRPQSSTAVDIVNVHKRVEECILRRLDKLAGIADVDQRWLAIGRTHMELAWMAINRAIFKPARVTLEGDAGVGEVIRMQRWCAETNQPAHVCPGCTMVATGGRR